MSTLRLCRLERTRDECIHDHLHGQARNREWRDAEYLGRTKQL